MVLKRAVACHLRLSFPVNSCLGQTVNGKHRTNLNICVLPKMEEPSFISAHFLPVSDKYQVLELVKNERPVRIRDFACF